MIKKTHFFPFTIVLVLLITSSCALTHSKLEKYNDNKPLTEDEIPTKALSCSSIDGLEIASKKDSLLPAYSPMFEVIPDDYTGIVKGCKSGYTWWFGEFRNGKKHGFYAVYSVPTINPKYEISSLSHYIDGVRDGYCYSYYPNGIISEKKPYKNGKLHGVIQYFNTEGALQGSMEYTEGNYVPLSSKGDTNVWDNY